MSIVGPRPEFPDVVARGDSERKSKPKWKSGFMTFATHPYLVISTLLLALSGCALLVRRDQWQPMLLSGVLSATWASTAFFFVPHYWNPARLIVFGIGVEDILYSFANGAIVWFLVAAGPYRLALRVRPRPFLMRYTACVVLGAGVFGTLWRGGVGVMTATLIAVAFVGGVVAWLQRPLRPLALVGAVGSTALYGAILGTALTLWPHLLENWTVGNLWGIYVFNVPLEELAWAAGFGAVWPLLIAYALDVRVIQES